MMRVAGRSNVNAVYRVEYQRVPGPYEKFGAQACKPWMYEYGAIMKRGGRQRRTEIVQPMPKPTKTWKH